MSEEDDYNRISTKSIISWHNTPSTQVSTSNNSSNHKVGRSQTKWKRKRDHWHQEGKYVESSQKGFWSSSMKLFLLRWYTNEYLWTFTYEKIESQSNKKNGMFVLLTTEEFKYSTFNNNFHWRSIKKSQYCECCPKLVIPALRENQVGKPWSLLQASLLSEVLPEIEKSEGEDRKEEWV